ncbi:MAG TPA: heparin lyase I family protein, partial [Candidatus Aquilonibacter sp.]|nr:heparin lyase I family protein [Candidatus Aquilonibacter sp.]
MNLFCGGNVYKLTLMNPVASNTRKSWRVFCLAAWLLFPICQNSRAQIIYFQNDGNKEGWPNYPQTPEADGTINDVANPVYQGTTAIQFTQTWLTNYTGRYHSEVDYQNTQGVGDDRYYRITLFLPTNWIYTNSNVCIQQWAGSGPWLIMEIRGNDLVMLPHITGIQTLQTMPLGQWTRIVTHLNTSSSNGLFQVWVNGIQRLNLTGNFSPTNAGSTEVRWSTGAYVTGWYGVTNAAPNPSFIELYGDNYRITDDFTDADTPYWPETYSVNPSPASQVVGLDASTSYSLNVTTSNGFSGNILFGLSGLPANTGYSFSSLTLSGAGSSTLTLTTSNNTPLGTYSLNAWTTNNASLTTNWFSTPLTLTVGSFTLSVSPPLQSVIAGNNTNFTVNVATNSGFSGSVTLGVSGLPSGASASFNPATLAQSGSSTLTITTTTNTLGGTYPITLSGTNGANVATAAVTLVVNGLTSSPGTLVWNGASGLDANWSTSLNWTNVSVPGNGPPGVNNNVIVGNLGAGPTNVINFNDTINSLWYQLLPASGGTITQFTRINPGVTLTVSGTTNITGSSFVTGNYSLLVGTNTSANAGGSTVSAVITGDGGTLNINNSTGIVAVAQFNSSGNHPPSASTWAVLDMSGLGTFSANVAQLQIGCMNNGSAGTLYLAKTNNLTLNLSASTYTTAAGQGLDIGFNNSNAGDPSFMYLGLANAIYVNTAIIGACKGLYGTLAFNPAFTNQNPTLLVRAADGFSPVTYWNIGDLLTSSSGANAECPQATNDFSGGTVDLLVDALTVGKTSSQMSSPPGAAPGTAGISSNRVVVATLTFNNGTIQANTLTNGCQVPNMGTLSSDTAIGTVNVNGNGTLIVNSQLVLAAGVASCYVGGNPTNVGVTLLTNFYYGTTVNATNAYAQGTLNVNGGTVEATNIMGGGGISTINLNSGTLDMQSANPFPGQIVNVSTLNVGANGVDDSAELANAATVTVSNAIVIAANGTLSGDTTITSPGLTVNGTISPGNNDAGGIINNGTMTLGAGGSYVASVLDAAAGPVSGWSFLQVNQGINIQATSDNPFIVSVQTPIGPAANFSYTTNYDWPIAGATGGIANFNANDFMVDNSQFNNDLAGGYFYVRQNGSSLVLSFTNNHPPA